LYVADAPKKQVGYEQLTVDGTSGGKALASVPTGAVEALIRVSTATIRWRGDAGTLDANTGYPQYADEEFRLVGALNTYKFIRTGGTSAVLDVAYYRG
jgi:hypothetical protein